MSQENVEIVRKVFDAMSTRDRETAVSYAAPDMVVDATRRVFNPTTYLGLEGLQQFMADMDEIWEEFRPDPREFLDAGDRVVVTGRMAGKGKGSGVVVEDDFAGIWTVRDGRVVHWAIQPDRASALAAVGLSD